MAPWARGQGIATEVVDAVARWGFDELGLARIGLEHVTRNPASCRVALKAGFPLEGTLRSAYLDPEGLRQDCHVHGRLATDPVPAGVTPLSERRPTRAGRCSAVNGSPLQPPQRSFSRSPAIRAIRSSSLGQE